MMSRLSEVRKARNAMSAAVGHDVRKLIAQLNAGRAEWQLPTIPRSMDCPIIEWHFQLPNGAECKVVRRLLTKAMTRIHPSDFLDLIPAMLQAPHRSMHCTYDEPADVMYVNFEPGAEATDSELGTDDIIVRYRHDEVIGLTIFHASRRARVNRD